MARYTVIQRGIEWSGKSGCAHFGDTRRHLSERPYTGIEGMVAIAYWPDTLVCEVQQEGRAMREMTKNECLGVENRLYAMDRGSADPWREGWKPPRRRKA